MQKRQVCDVGEGPTGDSPAKTRRYTMPRRDGLLKGAKTLTAVSGEIAKRKGDRGCHESACGCETSLSSFTGRLAIAYFNPSIDTLAVVISVGQSTSVSPVAAATRWPCGV